MAMIPAMTTGMMDFMMSSGRITDMAAMPVPLFAVPYAAPNAEEERSLSFIGSVQAELLTLDFQTFA